MSFLAASQIRKKYGDFEALKGVDLTVEKAQAFAIIGPNGAGKTTLFRVLTGETPADGGSVAFDGRDVNALPAHQRVRMGFGRTFQVARIFGELSILTNVIVAVEARRSQTGEPKAAWWDWRPSAEIRDEARAILESVGLQSRVDERASQLSHGDKKRLEFAITLAGRPRLLMLDEPTAGMSIADRRKTAQLLQKLKAEQITIVMTEHDMDIIFDIADRLMVLNYGEVVSVGDPEAVRQDETVKRVYLGRGAGHA